MKILYLSSSYIPSRRASSVHVMRMCAAFARQGHQVTLVSKLCPARQEEGVDDDHVFYGVEASFELRKLARPKAVGGGLVFAWKLRSLLEGPAAREADLLYCRDPLGAWLALRKRLPVVLEAHGPPRGRLAVALWRRSLASPGLQRLVLISQALTEELRGRGLLDPAVRPTIAHDGADPLPAAIADRPPALAEWDGLQVGYVGHLYPGRGIEILTALASALPQIRIHVLGGRDSDVARWRERAGSRNLIFHGFRPPAELAAYYSHFDLLLMPYQRQVGVASGRSDTAQWMSPMKMFEYMAAGKPIVASDLPVLREVLRHRENALLVPPEDVDAWTRAIQTLESDRKLAERLGETARSDLERRYTWDARAGLVLSGIA